MSEWIPLKMTIEEKENGDEFWHIEAGRLPEEGQEVLITTTYGSVEIDVFEADPAGVYFEDHDFEDIIAWMPLPEPYKEEEEGEE